VTVDSGRREDHAAAVVLTIPLGIKRRLSLAVTRRAGMSAVAWRKDFRVDPRADDEGGAGVREPARPIRPAGAGSVALPLD
jgi:hypothetical protein